MAAGANEATAVCGELVKQPACADHDGPRQGLGLFEVLEIL